MLLVCSSGASSGFIAKNIRSAAKDKGLNLDIVARSDTAIDDYIEEIDLLLVAPHLSFMVDDLKQYCKDEHVKLAIVPKEAYGNMDGNAIVDFIINTMKSEEKK